MEAPCHLSIIIPMFNEETFIQENLEKIVGYMKEQPYAWEIIAVDDGSADRTREEVRDFISRHPSRRITLLEKDHRGKGGAVKAGVMKAKGEILLFSDADQTMSIDQVEGFLSLAENHCELVIGSRWIEGSYVHNVPLLRRAAGKVFNLLARALTVKGLQDTQCGFKVLRREPACMLFERSKIEGFGFDVEILFLAQKNGLKIQEHPVHAHYGPSTSLRLGRDSLKMAGELIQIRWNDLVGRYRS